MPPSIPTEPAPERSASPGVEPSHVRVKRSITSDMFKTCRGLNIRPRRRDLSTCVYESTATERTPNARRPCRSAVVDGEEIILATINVARSWVLQQWPHWRAKSPFGGKTERRETVTYG